MHAESRLRALCLSRYVNREDVEQATLGFGYRGAPGACFGANAPAEPGAHDVGRPVRCAFIVAVAIALADAHSAGFAPGGAAANYRYRD